jgi:sugar phosphate isomerase/epimerase
MHRTLLTRAAAIVAAAGVLTAFGEPIPEADKIGGFAIGCQAYSFNRFTLFEAIAKTAETGSKVIELFPGQKLSPDHKDVSFSHDSSDEVVNSVKAELAKYGVKAVNYGVVGLPKDEAGARKVFEFAKKMGLYGITTESWESMDTIEKLVKEYDIAVGFHDHPRQKNNPNYKVWDPNFIKQVCEGRDARIGACADIGHWQTSGLKPVDCLKILDGRIISMHGKERPALGEGQHDVPFGAGATDMAGVLAELRRQGFKGNISVEYEHNWDNSVPDIAQCVGFVRGWAAAH